MLAACDVHVGNDAGEVSENASAAGKAQDGRLTVEAPGFNMSVNIPEKMRADAHMDSENLIYPGSTFGGIHVQGGRKHADGSSGGEVELRFSTADRADRVAAWYREPARRDKDVTIASVERQGDGFAISGTAGDDKTPFALHLAPRAGGGTDARLLISDNR
jgi:hypothetical protein